MRTHVIAGLATVLTAVALLLVPAAAAQVGAGFTETDTDSWEGTYVSFSFDKETGAISSYTLSDGTEGGESVTVFTSITFEKWAAQIDQVQTIDPLIFSAGAVWAAIGDLATIRAIDNPVGNLAIANVGRLAAPGNFNGEVGTIGDMNLPTEFLDATNTVTFTVGSTLTAELVEAEAAEGARVNITGDDFRGFLFVSNGTLSVSGSDIIVGLEGPHAIFFHGLPLFGMTSEDAAFEEDMGDAAARGDVGARASVTVDDSVVDVVVSPFRMSFRVSVSAATPGRQVSLEISSSESAGTIVVVDLPDEALDVNQEIRVTLDGQEVNQAASVDLVVEAKSQGQANPLVNLQRTSDGLTLSLWVPGFSTKTLTVETVGVAGDGTLAGVPFLWIVAGIAVVIVLLGIAAAVKRRRR